MYNAFDLTGKVVLATGSAHGIGFSMALAMAQAGATICFNCSNEGSLKRGLEAYREAGFEVHGYVADVTNEQEVTEMVRKINEEVGIIDVLINNAGIIKRIPMLETSAEDFKKVVDVDLVAPFICAKAVIPGMIQKGHGKIINVCSMMSELSLKKQGIPLQIG